MSKCPNCKGYRGRDYRGALTLLIVLLAFGIAFLKLLTGQGDETLIAPWIAGILNLSVGMYYTAKGGERMREMSVEKDEQAKSDKVPPTPK
jgi:hypothetical protein